MYTQTRAVLVVLVGVSVGVSVGVPTDLNGPAPSAGYEYGASQGGGGGYQSQPIPYTFEYGVQDEYKGADFSQNEESDGKTVRGSYTVQLPDGRKQTVTYTADDYTGYVAQVEYYGEAQYPYEYGPPVTFKPSAYPQQSYQSPQQSYQPPGAYN